MRKKKKQEICAKIFVQSTHVHLKHDFFGKLYYVPETNQKKAFFFLEGRIPGIRCGGSNEAPFSNLFPSLNFTRKGK